MKKIIFLLIFFIPTIVYGYDKALVDINDLSIEEIQEYVDEGYLTYEKITRLYLDRIDAYNTKYNALITINENALEEAKKLDIEYQENGRRSLIYGLPVIVKDNIDVKGMPTTNGTKALLDSYPDENAPVVQKLIDNGAIVIAKSNMDEFAFNAAFSYSSFGYVYNAYDTNYSSYGSSGGSAVGVAANLAVYALGTDTGSSIRIPASANGVIGLRPTFGLLNSNGVIKFEETRDTIGIITKYVKDNAIVLDIIDDKDIKYTDYITNSLDGITIGVINNFYNPKFDSNIDNFIYEMTNNAIKKLEQLGATIKYIDYFNLNYEFDATTMCYNFNQYIKNTNSKIKSLDDLIKNGNYTQYIERYNNYYCNYDYKQTYNYSEYIKNRNYNIELANNFYNKYNIDLILYPTLQSELIKISEIGKKIYTPCSDTAPLIGFPAISLPMGIYNNMSYNIEFMAKDSNESILFQVSSAFESVNKLYNTPDIAPSLYEIDDNNKMLLEYYKKYSNNNYYSKINKKVRENFINGNYNANELIIEYKNHKNFIFVYIIIIFIFSILILKVKKKKYKRKKITKM